MLLKLRFQEAVRNFKSAFRGQKLLLSASHVVVQHPIKAVDRLYARVRVQAHHFHPYFRAIAKLKKR